MLLHQFLKNSAARLPNKTALICGEHRLTYKQINDQANHLACFLRGQDIERQDRVAIFLDNSVESVISLFGILKADAVFLMLGSTLKAPKLSYILNDCRVKILITQTDKSSEVLEALTQAKTIEKILWVGPPERIPRDLPGSSGSFTFDEALGEEQSEKGKGQRAKGIAQSDDENSPYASRLAPQAGYGSPPTFESPQVASRKSEVDSSSLSATKNSSPYAPCPLPSANIDLDLATIIYTSGSTGTPKGVMLTHLNMVSAATAITSYLENKEDDIILNVLPLSFDYGLYQILMAFKFGGTIVLEKSFTFSYAVIEKMVQEKVKGFPLVPTILAILLGLKELGKLDFSNLRYITNTAAALPPAHIAELRKMFPWIKIYSMYGLTECKRVSYLPPEEIDRRPTSIGKGMPNEEVWIVDDQGNQVGPNVVGELVVRGSNVMRGYWGLPEETTRVLRPGKYPGETVLYTGDIFKKDEEGFLYFIGRKDDMIKCRGERISPREIENCLCALEGVAEAAVDGVPDQILGQAIVAYVRCKNGQTVSEKQVLKHCRHNLEDFMVPKYVRFLPAFPKTGSGKIDKLALKTLELEKK